MQQLGRPDRYRFDEAAGTVQRVFVVNVEEDEGNILQLHNTVSTTSYPLFLFFASSLPVSPFFFPQR